MLLRSSMESFWSFKSLREVTGFSSRAARVSKDFCTEEYMAEAHVSISPFLDLVPPMQDLGHGLYLRQVHLFGHAGADEAGLHHW